MTPVGRGEVMKSHLWNSKLIAVSCALAAAGILACAVAIIDVVMPRGSLVGFLAGMALLGLVVTAVVIGYTWVCDKCERWFERRFHRS
jgi:ABC-type Fe3+ transport system permease subunit